MMLSSVLGKCRSVTPCIFVCFMPFQVFPYYITLDSEYNLSNLRALGEKEREKDLWLSCEGCPSSSIGKSTRPENWRSVVQIPTWAHIFLLAFIKIVFFFIFYYRAIPSVMDWHSCKLILHMTILFPQFLWKFNSKMIFMFPTLQTWPESPSIGK